MQTFRLDIAVCREHGQTYGWGRFFSFVLDGNIFDLASLKFGSGRIILCMYSTILARSMIE